MNLIKRELSDWHNVLQTVPKVYDHLTGSRVSKVMTDPKAVIAMADEHITELMGIKHDDDFMFMRDDLGAMSASILEPGKNEVLNYPASGYEATDVACKALIMLNEIIQAAEQEIDSFSLKKKIMSIVFGGQK